MKNSRKKDTVIFIILFFIAIIIVLYSSYLLYSSYEDGEEKILNYNENMELNYKVLLKENDFYEEDYLDENYNVIASSIDQIEIDFDYLLSTSDYVKGKSYYTINSRIVVYQKADDKKVWDYKKLIKDKTITLYEKDTLNINSSDSFSIDYQEYKKLMNDYQKKYGVSLIGNLIIEVEVNSNLEYSKFTDNINFGKIASVTMSLTDSVINIKKNVPASKDTSQIIEKLPSKLNYLKLILSIMTFIGSIVLVVYLGKILVKIFGYDSKYVRKLSKIMRTYNSIIVSVEKLEFSKGHKVLKVQTFDELLDAQSELRVPILHCNIIKNKEDLFAIKYDDNMIIFEMKSSLYGDNKKELMAYE